MHNRRPTESLQFSVTMGLTSKTTTVTFRTAKVLANKAPIPEEPVWGCNKRVEVRLHNEYGLAASDKNDLLSPVESLWAVKPATAIAP
jgi:hypothetical protein